MRKRTRNKTSDAGVAALRLAMTRRAWDGADLASALGVSQRTVENNFANDFSSRPLRIKVNEVFSPLVIFMEGIG